MPDNQHLSRRPLEAVFYADGAPLTRCLVRRGRYVIGQEPKNEIVINEPSISGIHARLSLHSEDDIFIEDLGSANGTFVDGYAATGETRLGLNADVRLGAVELRFERSRLPAAVFHELPAAFLRPQRYDLGEAMVEGQTSTIFQARDVSLERDVAVKMMLPGSQRDSASVLRFVREAQITAQLPHPGILPIYELGINEQGRLFFTTRFIEGESLAAILDRLADGDERTISRYSLLTLLGIWQKACDAVAFAHSRGVMHTSLTPEAVDVGRFGEVFVTRWSLALVHAEAFGNSQHIHAPETAATPPLSAYTAPEQAADLLHDVDARTDIFALGGILYRILTLRDPLHAETDDALLEAALNASVPPPATLGLESPHPHWPRHRLPEVPSAVAMKALSYARENRHQTVAELQHEMSAWQEGAASGADLATLWKQFTGSLRPH